MALLPLILGEFSQRITFELFLFCKHVNKITFFTTLPHVRYVNINKDVWVSTFATNKLHFHNSVTWVGNINVRSKKKEKLFEVIIVVQILYTNHQQRLVSQHQKLFRLRLQYRCLNIEPLRFHCVQRWGIFLVLVRICVLEYQH